MLFVHTEIGCMAALLFPDALGFLQAEIQNHGVDKRRSESIQHKGLYRLMPAAMMLVKPHRHFGVTVPVFVKGRKKLRRWRATQYRVFQHPSVRNNKMADALRTVDNKRTTPSQQKDDPWLVKCRFHTLPSLSPTAVFLSKFI